MSGALSIPFALAALLAHGLEKTIFAVLAYCALWVFAFRVAWKNYEILAVRNPAEKAALLTKMVDLIKSSKEHDQTTRSPASFTTYDYARAIQPDESIGALIRFADEIPTEEDREWLCHELEKLGYKPPLKNFRPVLEDELKGQWLPVLREARLRPDEIKKETQFLAFLCTTWSAKEKWKRGQDRIGQNETRMHQS